MTVTVDTNRYREQGFLVVRGLIPPLRVRMLVERLEEYTQGLRPNDAVTMQVEPRVERGELEAKNPAQIYRKIEGLVEADDLFRRLGLDEAVVGVVEQILGPDIKMFRNAVLLKPPGVGSPKGIHQDSPYWPIEPMDLCSCWLALDEATPENGCMCVQPGGHLQGELPHIHVTDDYVIQEGYYRMEDLVEVSMKPGDGLFFHSLLPHYTAPNRTDRWRRAVVLSYMSAKSKFTGEGEGPTYFHVRGRSHPGCVR